MTCHTRLGASYEEIFTQDPIALNTFVEQNPKEIILLDFQHSYDSSTVMAKLSPFLEEHLCPRAVTRDEVAQPAIATADDIWATGKQYIILIPADDLNKLSEEARACAHDRRLIKSYYDDEPEADLWKYIECQSACFEGWEFQYEEPRNHIESYQMNKLDDAVTFQVSQFIWYYADSSADNLVRLATSGQSLESATREGLAPHAVDVARALDTVALRAPKGSLNVFLMDFIEGTSITEPIWKLNLALSGRPRISE